MAAEELRPFCDPASAAPGPLDQPDPEPDVAQPSYSSRQLPPWEQARLVERRDGSNLLGKSLTPLLPNTDRTVAPAATVIRPVPELGRFWGWKALESPESLRAFMVVVLTSLASMNMICLTAAKHAAGQSGQGSFKFEYVTVTLMQEIGKFCVASVCMQLDVWSGAPVPKPRFNRAALWDPDFLQFGIPGLLYCFDNNFQYVILGFLQPAELAILWNFKIFATTLLLHVFLKRRYTRRQWVSMAMLVLGCAATQARDFFAAHGQSGRGAIHFATAAGASPVAGHISRAVADFQVAAPTVAPATPPSKLVGVGLAFLGSSIAASGNVFCEYLVKDKSEDSMHLQNMQLYFFGILLNLATLFLKAFTDLDSPIHGPGGFFAGYNNLVWLVIFLGSISGIAVSVTLKYVDNIAVIFAHALAMIVVALASAEFFGLEFSASFVFGGMLVLAALYMFHADVKEGAESRGGIKDQATLSLLGTASSNQNVTGRAFLAREHPMYCLDTGF